MMSRHPTSSLLTVALMAALLPNPALAYIGPGAGLGALAVTLAVGLGVLLLIVGLVWYPLKRMLKRSPAAANDAAE